MRQAAPEKILMTADTIGGVWTFAIELVQALQQFNAEVHLATMGEPMDAGQRKEANRLPNLTVWESSYALEWMEEPWVEVKQAGNWLLDLERKIEPDLVHLNNFVHGSLPWQAPVLVVGHSCILSWWRGVKGKEAPGRWQEYKEKVRQGLQAADGVVGVSYNMLESLKQDYGPFQYSEVIYNGRSAQAFQSLPKEPVIFSMGRLWDEAKNIQTLEKIARKLDWPVYIAGEDGKESRPNNSNVKFLGKLSSEEVARWLGKTSIFVMPARYEPFGLAPLEAAFSSCALVLGDIPTLREVWKDAAMFAHPDDKVGLYHQIQSLITNTAKRQQMVRKAGLRAKRYSAVHFGQRYVDLYKQLLYEPVQEVAE